DDEEEQLPGRLSFRRLQPVRAAAGDDLQCRTQTVAHLPGGVGEEVLVQLQRSQEQLRSGSIDLGVEPRSVQLAPFSGPRTVRVARCVPLLVLDALAAQASQPAFGAGQLGLDRPELADQQSAAILQLTRTRCRLLAPALGR